MISSNKQNIDTLPAKCSINFIERNKRLAGCASRRSQNYDECADGGGGELVIKCLNDDVIAVKVANTTAATSAIAAPVTVVSQPRLVANECCESGAGEREVHIVRFDEAIPHVRSKFQQR